MSRLSIGQRLALGFALVLFLCVLTTGIGLWRLHETARETADMMQTPLAKERLVSDWYANVNAGVRRTAAIARSSDPSLVAFFAEDVAEASKASSHYQKSIEALLSTPREREVFAEVGGHRKQFIAVRDRIAEHKKAGRVDAASGGVEHHETVAAPQGTATGSAWRAGTGCRRLGGLRRVVARSDGFLQLLDVSQLGLGRRGLLGRFHVRHSIGQQLRVHVQAAAPPKGQLLAILQVQD